MEAWRENTATVITVNVDMAMDMKVGLHAIRSNLA